MNSSVAFCGFMPKCIGIRKHLSTVWKEKNLRVATITATIGSTSPISPALCRIGVAPNPWLEKSSSAASRAREIDACDLASRLV
jgi:hypothetical protein